MSSTITIMPLVDPAGVNSGAVATLDQLAPTAVFVPRQKRDAIEHRPRRCRRVGLPQPVDERGIEQRLEMLTNGTITRDAVQTLETGVPANHPSFEVDRQPARRPTIR